MLFALSTYAHFCGKLLLYKVTNYVIGNEMNVITVQPRGNITLNFKLHASSKEGLSAIHACCPIKNLVFCAYVANCFTYINIVVCLFYESCINCSYQSICVFVSGQNMRVVCNKQCSTKMYR